ncbi:gluconokinase [Pseudarthrobacter chlorophenolicus]|uniref:gluconokinase n=1 Tax=Pseudarthrobacter chlorophenolicus TaxID=85085 RepID=UPI0005F299CA|nr:gluconokinase [Pseudarthrobacter chlorophenolicus]
MSANSCPPMVVMGVSGSGKSTVGSLLGRALGVTFIDGDDLHPAANKVKMGAGSPLNDEDRAPWLQAIGLELQSGSDKGRGVIIACSALKRRYRDVLRHHAPEVLFVHLDGAMDTLAHRMAARDHEFMPASLLASQLEALEPLGADERHILLDIRLSPNELAGAAAAAVRDMAGAAITTTAGG